MLPPPAMAKRWIEQPGIRKALARCIRLYLVFALRTTRWRLEGASHVAPYLAGAPVVAAFWHEFLPLMSALRWRSIAPMAVLISRHRDGQIIADVLRGLGTDVVHGSTSRGGAVGLRRLLARLAAGSQVVITPDGPRGPRREAAPGAARLAALSGVPVLPCAAAVRWRIPLKTWDHMTLPLPFGRGVIVCGPVLHVARADDPEAALAAIAAALNATAETAERWIAG